MMEESGGHESNYIKRWVGTARGPTGSGPEGGGLIKFNDCIIIVIL